MPFILNSEKFPRSFATSLSCQKGKRKRSDSVLWQKPLHAKTNQKSNMTTQKRHQKFDYTTIADRLRTVSWKNNIHPLVWLYGILYDNVLIADIILTQVCHVFRTSNVSQYFCLTKCHLIYWLVVLGIYLALAVFQPYRDFEAGDNQPQVARPGIEPRTSCSASQELYHSTIAAQSLNL